MIRNQLKLFIRNLSKEPHYYLLNLAGLTIGIGACFLIMQYALYELQFDSAHPNAADSYRVIVQDSDGWSATTPVPTAEFLKDAFPQIIYQAKIRKTGGIIEVYKDRAKIRTETNDAIMAAGDFFKLFNISLPAETVINEPNLVYINQTLATSLFGEIDVIGQALNLYEPNFGKLQLTIGGVYPDVKQSHMAPHMIVSLETIRNNNTFWAKFDNWSWNDFYTYVSLESGSSISEEEFRGFLHGIFGEEMVKDLNLKLQGQELTNVHFGKNIANEFAPTSNKAQLQFLLLVGFLTLVMACINYVNLSTARGFKRAKEVGIRKNLGATRTSLIRQFSLETGMLVVVAMTLSITLIQLLLPVLNGVVDVKFGWEPFLSIYGMLLLVPLFIAVLWSIVQPAWLISNFSMITILKGAVLQGGKGRTMRKVSVIIQFSVALVLMITSFLVYQQVNYLQSQPLGMEVENKIIVSRPKENVENYGVKALTFKERLKSVSKINNVSISGSVPLSGYNYGVQISLPEQSIDDELVNRQVSITYIDSDYITLYNIKVLAGEIPKSKSDSTVRVVLNESALRRLNVFNPDDVLNRKVLLGKTEAWVVAVVKDYFHNSVKQQADPLVFILDTNAQNFSISYEQHVVSVKGTAELVEIIQKIYLETFGDVLFDYQFLDQEFAAVFEQEQQLGTIILLFTILAISLSLLGLLGLATFDTENKTKEMGVRKVLGANNKQLLTMLSKQFILLITLSSFISLPVSYLISRAWLEEFIVQYPIAPSLFGLPVMVLVVLTYLTVGYHILKLSKTNPIDHLRYE